MHKTSWSATLSAVVGVLGFLGVVVGVGGAQFDLLPPLIGFELFALGLVFGGAPAFLFGLIGLLRTGARSGRLGRGRAWMGAGLGLGLVGALAYLLASIGDVPPIHDITTNPDDPPSFKAAAEHPDNQGRDLSYPHGSGDVTAQQRQAYPDLGPIELSQEPKEAFEAVLQTAQELGWKIVAEDADEGHLEATEISRIFRFVDDIVVRIRPANGGSVVDVRSTSRVGQSDLGANAERIRRFAERLGG